MRINTLNRAAVSAWLAIPALVLSAVFLALFFSGAGGLYGSLNDLFVAVTALLLTLPAWAMIKLVRARFGRWFEVLSLIAMAGMGLIAIGQGLLIVRVISLNASFITGTLGILPVLAWVGAQAYVALRSGVPSRLLGWSVIATLGASAFLTVATMTTLQAAVWPLSALLLAALITYLAVLGRDLAGAQSTG